MISQADVQAEAVVLVGELTAINRILNRRLEATRRELADLRSKQLIGDLSQPMFDDDPSAIVANVEGPDT